jgi:hypothetical protein
VLGWQWERGRGWKLGQEWESEKGQESAFWWESNLGLAAASGRVRWWAKGLEIARAAGWGGEKALDLGRGLGTEWAHGMEKVKGRGSGSELGPAGGLSTELGWGCGWETARETEMARAWVAVMVCLVALMVEDTEKRQWGECLATSKVGAREVWLGLGSGLALSSAIQWVQLWGLTWGFELEPAGEAQKDGESAPR